jgi:uncharacterized membrane protein YphA (DoxX/SURF4 family)
MDRRRQLGAFAVLSLVLLRLAIGWHFYREGSSKFTFDPATRTFDLSFSAEGFLSQAKGPLAERFKSFAPSGHGWSELLAVGELKVATSAGEESGAPYDDWLQRITEDWQKLATKVSAVAGATDDQRKAAEAALATRQTELTDYLATQADAIADYQHELGRIVMAGNSPEAGDVPFVERRLANQIAQTRRTPMPWLAQIEKLDENLTNDLRNIFTDEQRADAATAKAIEDAVTTDEERRLQMTNIVVAALTVGVGICLLVGLLTRLASLAGALFLLTVIAAQPPWVPGSAETYYQTIELAGLLVLAGTGAGRWAGLDFFGYALWNKCRGRAAVS